MKLFRPLEVPHCLLMAVPQPCEKVIIVTITPMDAERLNPIARGLIHVFVRIRMTKHEMTHAPPAVRKKLVLFGSMYEAVLSCEQGLPLIAQLNGFLRGAATMGICLMATMSQLRRLVRSHPHLRETLENIMTATTPETIPATMTPTYLGLQPFEACPSPCPAPSPDAPAKVSAKQKTSRPRGSHGRIGGPWESPCSHGPRIAS